MSAAGAEPFRPPSIEEIVSSPEYAEWVEGLSRPLATELIRSAVDDVRAEAKPDRAGLAARVRARLEASFARRQQPVLNATGVLLHTNLGRAPLDHAFLAEWAERLLHYGTLEFNLGDGSRGKRGALVHQYLARLCATEAGLVVNNCAAAVLLMLAELRGSSVIVSRGELVQIGGGFRIPEIMAQSGARLIETGTTNRTGLADYERAIDADTAAILKVYQSNFTMSGFVEAVPVRQLRQLCDRHGLLLLEDLGSGAVSDLSGYGLPAERTLATAVGDAVDVACASGDKLLGGPQAGLLVGTAEAIGKLARHPLFRALRPDKVTLAALEITLHAHLTGRAEEVLPLYRLLAETPESLARRGDAIVSQLASPQVEIRTSDAVTGGGTLPGATIPSIALVMRPDSPEGAAARLRHRTPPVIARVQQDEIWFDLKTVFPGQDQTLAVAIASLLA